MGTNSAHKIANFTLYIPERNYIDIFALIEATLVYGWNFRSYLFPQPFMRNIACDPGRAFQLISQCQLGLFFTGLNWGIFQTRTGLKTFQMQFKARESGHNTAEKNTLM